MESFRPLILYTPKFRIFPWVVTRKRTINLNWSESISTSNSRREVPYYAMSYSIRNICRYYWFLSTLNSSNNIHWLLSFVTIYLQNCSLKLSIVLKFHLSLKLMSRTQTLIGLDNRVSLEQFYWSTSRNLFLHSKNTSGYLLTDLHVPWHL